MDTLGMGVLLGFGGAMVVFLIIGFIEYISGEPDISDIVKEYITSAPLRKLFTLRRIMDEVIEERLAERRERNAKEEDIQR